MATEISFVAYDWAEGSVNGTTLNVPYPAGLAAGDLLIAHINCGPGAPQSYPDGWTHFTGSPALGGLGSTEQNTVWQYKVATGDETGTQTWTRESKFSRMVGAMSAWRAVDPDAPEEDTDVTAGDIMIPITTGTVDTAGDDSLLVLLWAMTGAHGSSAISPPSGWTEVYDKYRSGEHHIELSYWQVATAGTQGTFDMVSDTGPAGPYEQTALLVALKLDFDVAPTRAITPSPSPGGIGFHV